MRRPTLLSPLVALALLGLPAAAVDSQNGGGGGISMAPGLVLHAAAPRQLTLNAHVAQFLYQPGGDGIAYVSVRDDGGSRTATVKFVGVRQKDPDTRTLYSVTGDGPAAPDLRLLDWSADGRYLVFQQADPGGLHAQFLSGDIGTLQVRTIPAPSGDSQGVSGCAWSPARQRLLVTEDHYQAEPGGTSPATVAEVYDPATDKTALMTVAAGLSVRGWLDDGHLLLVRRERAGGTATAYYSHDIAADTDTETPRPARRGLSPSPQPAGSTPRAPGLSLEVQPQTLRDRQGVAGVQANAVWIRRVRAPRALSALAVGVTPGGADPQAQWSPEGDAVAFVAHEDLFVAGLTEQDATPRERAAAGEMGCDEERQIAQSNLKQLGLALTQYAQDYDGLLPPAGGWHDAVFAYVKDEDVLAFPGAPLAYRAPADLAVKAIADPATTVIGTADLPCARLVLYADGSVKSFPKGAGGASGVH